ncbi:MAG TPA: GNAT family protein [Allosphingosinicella sp.]|jgi:RimJ/RimL family protein N-acetyltransferase
MIFTESERLVLRRPEWRDLEPLIYSWSHPEMSRWTPERADRPGFIRQLIEDMLRKEPGETEPGGPWYQFIAERRADGALVGDIGIGFGVPGERQAEIGYRILPEFHRQGYGREAAAAMIDFLIARHGIHRFVGLVASPNEPSKALLKSLGFRHEGHFRESFWCRGEWVDDDYFALLASEWQGRG